MVAMELKPAVALTDPNIPSIGYLCSAHPLMGGEYYRATRPGALANWKFGWQTAAGTEICTLDEDESGPLSLITPNKTVVTPKILIVRPVKEWRKHWSDQAHANGQFVVADIDDDVWAHDNYDELQESKPDFYDEWFFDTDAVLVSTRHLATRIRSLGHKGPVLVAPNCFDPFGMNSNPRPGGMIGTRLWMSGRMEADLEMYDTLIQPLLEEFDMSFLHVGADAVLGRFTDRGWNPDRLVERHSVPIPMLAQALDGLSYGSICMSERPYNDAKTETHAVELGSCGIPLVAASNHPAYKNVPGRVNPDVFSVRSRVEYLRQPYEWLKESDKARRWARSVSLRSETKHMESLLSLVNMLLSR